MEEKKYWIYPGISCSHSGLPFVEIFVDEIERLPADETGKKKLVGVKCHWLYNGVLQRGTFRTDELKPFDNGV